ncbi:MAG: general secretion pathway protein GspF, partial [Gammaproteobacteria bacterium]|nr:general secretion pathway protein GspF [Gammaproteobacteria bacterium]
MAKRRKHFEVNEPLRHADHARPVTRREFIRQGFMSGSAVALTGGVFSLFADPRAAMAAISPDLNALAAGMTNQCILGGTQTMIPFICFELAGGANLAGSNALVGKTAGQMDFLTTAGYSKLGLPGDIIPGLSDTTVAGTMLNTSDGNFVNSQLGLK